MQKAIALMFLVTLSPQTHAEPLSWAYKGICRGSSRTIDFEINGNAKSETSDIKCGAPDIAFYKNNRFLLTFRTLPDGMPIAFAGKTNTVRKEGQKMVFDIDRIYPVRNFGNDITKVKQKFMNGEGVLDGSTGTCSLENQVDATPQKPGIISCDAEHPGDVVAHYHVMAIIAEPRSFKSAQDMLKAELQGHVQAAQ